MTVVVDSFLIALVLVLVLVCLAAAPVARARPERAALVLAVLAVAAGVIAATVGVVDGVRESRVAYSGSLDAADIRRSFQSEGNEDPVPRLEELGQGYVTRAEGEMTVPGAGAGLLTVWGLAELAPWLLAAVGLALLVPLLFAAERGDPFGARTGRQLAGVGWLLLAGLPAIAIARSVVAEAATSASSFAAPMAEPSLLLSVEHVLPGLLALVLAGVFRRGSELRELERATV